MLGLARAVTGSELVERRSRWASVFGGPRHIAERFLASAPTLPISTRPRHLDICHHAHEWRLRKNGAARRSGSHGREGAIRFGTAKEGATATIA